MPVLTQTVLLPFKGMIVYDGYLYGANNSILTCLEFATGKLMWRDRSVGKGSLTYADSHLYLFSEDNVVGLAEANGFMMSYVFVTHAALDA